MMHFISKTLFCIGVMCMAISSYAAPSQSKNINQGATQKMTEKDNTITTPSGLKYVDIQEGTGPIPVAGKTVVVHYTGTLENGTKFDSSVDRGDPFRFPIGKGVVIKGWDEGVMSMKVGGKRKLIIPADLGYGSRAIPGVIPANSTLLFDVELISIE
ncbi:FKBP-type peptidyl-prolyl cis-trans isomerase [Candidatus Bodocaedibacter vickermanii]|uniref:Peptidyl-prolyl cis-trans isomerase n=2 Tax=Candidatus Bodocaedibacter vickermanii TaxID=2741701 RepID=A0A7L9RT60_9PROT|nr:FKBP-type peptidyl-prolyl cis-trans isomerase [Candidatus Paracaedibacteraceae bacterium 'Lake Konstanz']